MRGRPGKYYLNSFLFPGIVSVLFIVFGCSETKNDSVTIGEQDKSVFFLTSKGTYWWWIHKDENENNWKLLITDVQNRQLVATTVFSNTQSDFKFNWQQTGDKLWYITPENNIEARNIIEGTVTENNKTLRSKFMNLKSDVEKAVDVRGLMEYGYFLTSIDGSQWYFDNSEMFVTPRFTLETIRSGIMNKKHDLVVFDSCSGNEKCCPGSFYMVNQKAKAGRPYSSQAYDTANYNIESQNLRKTIYNAWIEQDDLFAFILWVNGNELFLDCFDKKTKKIVWSVNTGEKLPDCDIRFKYKINTLKGQVLLQNVGTKNSAKVFNIQNGTVLTEVQSEELLASIISEVN